MSGTGGFQTQVFDQPSAAVAGDRASQNPLFSYDAGPGALVAGPSLFVGRFAWVTPPFDPNGAPSIANSFGAGAPAGFLMRNQQGLQPTYLSFAGMQVQQGYETALQIGGDFWVVNDGTTEALYGQKAYADFLTGKVSFAATGAPTTGASATGSVIAPETFSVTGSISGDVMTVTAVGSGSIYKGSTISGSGVTSGNSVVAQLSGTPNGVGTYRVAFPEQTVAAGTTISGTYGQLTVGTLTTTPVFAVGDTCTHADVSLSEGDVEDGGVECWLHGSRFDLKTGQPSGLPANRPVPTYSVTIEGDDVLVDVETRS